MCVKIIHQTEEQEFNVSQPLELQIKDAKEILVNYDPYDTKIDHFISEIEKMIENGINCNLDIKFNPNNNLEGFRLERYLEKLKSELNVNKFIKDLSLFHVNADLKLNEISRMCLGKTNEQ
jgi:hypothetical protein